MSVALMEALNQHIESRANEVKIRAMARRQYRDDGTIEPPKSLSYSDRKIFNDEMQLIIIDEDSSF